jgi:microsomal dipeptidase-like Zn-dependent dipeptidase
MSLAHSSIVPAFRLPILLISLLLVVSITALAQQQSQELEGYADVHVHQMGNLGFSGSIIWGYAYGPPKEALGPIPSKMRRGHDTTEVATHGGQVSTIFKTLIDAYLFDAFRHGEEGYPSFSSWPNNHIWMHQQVYEDWLFRAYQGGLRLMVMLAVNSEDMFGRGENQLPLIGSSKFQKVRFYGRTGNDMEALEWQIREAYRFQDYIDAKFHGKGNGWYRIVREPEEASEVIKSGKLAVILGTELQHLFNCDMDRPACTPEDIVEGLNRLEAMGVNYVFPIHHKLNQFGGPAMFTPVNSGDMEKCPPVYTHRCSKDGLTDLGRFLVKELTTRGMLIDTEHLSIKSFNGVMSIVEPLEYPVLAGHVVPFDVAEKPSLTERAKTREQISRILNVGGIVAPLLATSAREYTPVNHSKIPIKCHSSDSGSADEWANAYLFLLDVAGGGVSGSSGRIAIGSDWNGFAGWPGPRDRCDKTHEVKYPFDLPKHLVPAAIGGTLRLNAFEFPKGKLWEYDKTGLAHVGLLPDFFENVRKLGLNDSDLEPIYRSARGVVELWKSARNDPKVVDDRHHLRWAPQSPFDVLKFEYHDSSRDVSAALGLPPICRSRRGHLLGFEQNGQCMLVESSMAPTMPVPEQITAYHAGRCLDIAATKEGAKVVQNRCNSNRQQLWQVRSVIGTQVQVVNIVTGKCLAVKNSSTSEGANAIQQACSGQDNQTFDAPRFGNTFRLGKHSNLCLEVRDQTRKDGAAIQQAHCTGASNQQWSIESLRGNDIERLYQADKNQIAWQDHPAAPFVVEVTVDDDSRSICKSTDGQNWIGIVTNGQCVGKTYDGAAVTTSRYLQLYQAK